MQAFNFSKVNSIDVLLHWVVPDVIYLLEENLKTNSTHDQHLYFLPSLLQELSLVVCLDNP